MIGHIAPKDARLLTILLEWVGPDGVRIRGDDPWPVVLTALAARLAKPEREIKAALRRLLRANALLAINDAMWYVNPTLTQGAEPWWYHMFDEPIPPRGRDNAPRVYRYGRCMALVRHVDDLKRPGRPRRHRMRFVREA